MKGMSLFSILLSAFSSISLFADPVCHRCEVIREYNKEHPGDFEYYEDYLEAGKKQSETDKNPAQMKKNGNSKSHSK